MATLGELTVQLNDACVALGMTRALNSDYIESERIDNNISIFELRVNAQAFTATSDSNTNYLVADCEIQVGHRITAYGGFAERSYTELAMRTEMLAMVAEDFWTDLPAVHSIFEEQGPEVTEKPARELGSKIVTYTIAALVRLVP